MPVVDEIGYDPKRKADFNSLTRLGSIMIKAQPFLWLGAILFAAAGFGWQTPQKKFEQIEAEVRANRDAAMIRSDSLISQVNRIQVLAELLTIDLCTRRGTDPYVQSRLRCRALYADPATGN